MAEKFDVIIIGGGNAGFGVSAVAHEAGKTIAFIEERDFGGTCPNRGCTPKKVLVAAAHALHEIEQASVHGITVGEAKLDWAKLIERKQELIDFIPGAMLSTAEKRATVFQGSAKFTGPNTISIDGQTIEGDNIVIATGSTPRPLPIPGAEHMITSDEILSECEQPDEVVFVGGGVIAMEFSHVYARAGTKVTILEALPQLLPRMDADAVAELRKETERLGVIVKTGVKVNKITRIGGQLIVSYEHLGSVQRLEADRVVNGAGRIANVTSLDLDAGNVKHDGIRIDVDEYLRSTSNQSVWVAGDALVHSAQLSPIATYEGRIVGHNIVNGPEKSPDYAVIPSAVYSIPALSTVGLSEQEAKDAGIKVKVTTADMTGWFATKTYAETLAWSKVLVDEQTDNIIGAHMLGHHGEELIHLFAMAMRHGITATDLKELLLCIPDVLGGPEEHDLELQPRRIDCNSGPDVKRVSAMNKMAMVPEAPEDPQLKEMFDEIAARWPQVPNLYRMLGHAPDMLQGWIDMAWSLRLKATTSRRVRELMILRGARMTETSYEWAHHVPMALEAGVCQAEVDALMAGETASTFTDAERAALRLAEEVTAGPAASPGCMAELRQYYSDAEAVELVLTASFYVCVGRTLKSLDVPLEPNYQAPW